MTKPIQFHTSSYILEQEKSPIGGHEQGFVHWNDVYVLLEE